MDFQSGHTLEFPFIVCDQDQLGGVGMRGDPQIVVPDDPTAGFQFGSKGTIAATRFHRQRQDGQETDKFFKLPHRSLALLALFGSID